MRIERRDDALSSARVDTCCTAHDLDVPLDWIASTRTQAAHQARRV